MRADQERIAIVGVGGLFPGAADLAGFWRNIEQARDCASHPPPGRWAVAPETVFDPRPATPDRVHSLRGYYLPPFTPDLTGLDLGEVPVNELDPVFHVALQVVNSAWRSAKTDQLNRRAQGGYAGGVVMGNIALPTGATNSLTREVLGPTLGDWFPTPDIPVNRLNRGVPALPIGLAARGLRFTGGGYALDAACASSLYAVKFACDELLAGRADVMIAGGMNRPDSLYTQMGFAQLRALSATGRCSPFDAAADGLVVGEGGCAFVLKRLSDAVAHGDAIWGVIAGIGLSNDVDGNLLMPASEGQLRAMRTAYRLAGWRPGDVQLIECHATGTPVGDAVEFESLRQLWQEEYGRAVIGCVKSTVGHLLTGAGAAGLAKVLLAFRHRTLPPTANFNNPSPKLGYANGPFRVLRRPEKWDSDGPRRAAVSAFGFGGINAHVLIEEWTGEPEASATGVSVAPVADAPGAPVAVVGLAMRREARLDSLTVSLARFRIPPKELEETLPQQILMLQVAADAVDDVRSRPADGMSTGVYIGLTLDPNTTNFHLRWTAGDVDESLKDAVHPPLTANRTMGALGSIAASRIARFFAAGGPSFALADDEASGLRGVLLAVGALRRCEIDRAIVGAVDLASDPQAGGGPDVAAAVVLKRLDDARRDGDRVYAVVTDPRPAVGSARTDLDAGQAAIGLASFVDACRVLDCQVWPGEKPAFDVHNRVDGPRRLLAVAGGPFGNGVGAVLEEAPDDLVNRRPAAVPLADRPDGLFTLTAETAQELAARLGELRALAEDSPARLARKWWLARRGGARGSLGLAFVAETPGEFRQLIDLAARHLRERPNEPAADRFFYSPAPLGGEVAFVYPGSGNHFPDMGRDLGAAFPQVLGRQSAENDRLRSQYHADQVWGANSLDSLAPLDLIFAQVALGTLVSDLLVSLEVTPKAVIPYSLGESAGLFGTRAWRDRDEMLSRMEESPIFRTELAGPCDAARQTWDLRANEPVDWLTGVISAPAKRVREAIRPGQRVYIQIVNTADDCVIGGRRADVEDVIGRLGGSFHEVRGVSTAHCEVARPVRDAYRALHHLPTIPPDGVRYYSGAWGRAYDLTADSAADAITAAVLDTIDFPRVVDTAYADGARVFVEIGPGASCARMIGSILAGRPHLARAACVPRQDNVSVMLRLLANLHAEGVPVDLSVLYGGPDSTPTRPVGPTITLPVGYHPKPVVRAKRAPVGTGIQPVLPDGRAGGPSPLSPVAILADTQTATIQAHEAYLWFSTELQTYFAQAVAAQTAIFQRSGRPWRQVSEPAGSSARTGSQARTHEAPSAVPRSLDFNQCMEFARGKVGNVLGPRFGEIDSFPTRVRLPDGPLQLVDRVVAVEGEPLSLTSGRVVTEHLVHDKRWYLENGGIPACISIEAGQADLFLSGFLGIDFKTRGLACYRLLDAAVTFHRGLPKAGEQVRYDIRIDHFFRQGDTYLFRFRFDGIVNGEPLLTMRDGCAGFFTAEELAGGKGIVHTEMDRKPMPSVKPDGWSPHVLLRDESLSDAQIDALRTGDLVAAFGPEFARANLKSPVRLPGGMMRLVHRVERIEPTGGRFGLGRIRGEADIHPDDWFLTCHFVDDQVMPGTLMYECCLHTLRILLMRMGWVAEEGEAGFEPVPGVASRLRCRGQVIASTKKVTYEVWLKEVGFRPEPYAIGDALMYADGKPIVEVKDISLRLVGLTRERQDEIWAADGQVWETVERGVIESVDDRDIVCVVRGTTGPKAVFTRDQVIEFATGSPSKAFGDRYRPFDHDRFIARLPAPPYSFLDRVVRVENCEPWKLAAGGVAVAEYNVPPDAWYFASNRCDRMPYSVLNEVALQACGWMCAYLGSALTSPDDLHFRNLGGNATQYAEVRPDSGTLTTTVKMTRASSSAGMIIVQFEFDVSRRGERVYVGDTHFGFFTKSALANQVGLKDAKLIGLTGAAGPNDHNFGYHDEPPFPDSTLRMVDTISWLTMEGGPKGLGAVEGRAGVNPGAWFFKAHFHQDPVWPGSLGLESLVQLMKVYAHRRWGDPRSGWQAMALNEPHQWTYRGQIVPVSAEVAIQAYITEIDDSRRFLKANGLLTVDGRTIYQMSNFTLQG